jgi:hypothetical protein
VVIECYGKINADKITLEGTVATTAGSGTLVGTGTTFDGAIGKDDELVVITGAGEVSSRVISVDSNVRMNVLTTFANTEAGLTAYIPGNVDVWSDRVLKDLATAMIKRQWGMNLKKFSGIQMPGGVTLNGQIIYDEAEAELAKMKAEFISWNTLQSDFLMG